MSYYVLYNGILCRYVWTVSLGILSLFFLYNFPCVFQLGEVVLIVVLVKQVQVSGQ